MGKEGYFQGCNVGGASENLELKLLYPVQRQEDPLGDAVGWLAYLHPLCPATIWPGIRADMYGLDAALTYPPTGQALLAVLYQPIQLSFRPADALGLLPKLAADLAGVRLERRHTIRRHATVPERVVGKRRVTEDLSIHPLIDIASQMLAEFAGDVLRDRLGCLDLSKDANHRLLAGRKAFNSGYLCCACRDRQEQSCCWPYKPWQNAGTDVHGGSSFFR